MDLQDHMISYVTKRQMMKSLEDYACGQEGALKLINLRRAAMQALETDDGKAAVRRWLEVFAKARHFMLQFDIEYQTGTMHNATDWRIMDESVTTTLGLLEKTLLRLSIAQASR